MSWSTFHVVWVNMRPFRGSKVEKHFEMGMAFEISKCRHVVRAYLEGHGMVHVRLCHFAYDSNAQHGQ